MQVSRSVEWVDGRSACFVDVHRTPFDAFLREVFARVTPRTTLVDAGCRGGEVALPLASRVREVTAVDGDEARVRALAQVAASRRVRNVTFYQSNLDEEPWTAWLPRRVDVCVMHLGVTRARLRHAADALASGTPLVLAAYGENQWRETGVPPADAWTGAALHRALGDAGFRDVHLVEELRVANAPNLEVLEHQYFRNAPEQVAAWREDGRWERLAKGFRGGAGNLTESRLVATATAP